MFFVSYRILPTFRQRLLLPVQPVALFDQLFVAQLSDTTSVSELDVVSPPMSSRLGCEINSTTSENLNFPLNILLFVPIKRLLDGPSVRQDSLESLSMSEEKTNLSKDFRLMFSVSRSTDLRFVFLCNFNI